MQDRKCRDSLWQRKHQSMNYITWFWRQLQVGTAERGYILSRSSSFKIYSNNFVWRYNFVVDDVRFWCCPCWMCESNVDSFPTRRPYNALNLCQLKATSCMSGVLPIAHHRSYGRSVWLGTITAQLMDYDVHTNGGRWNDGDLDRLHTICCPTQHCRLVYFVDLSFRQHVWCWHFGEL